MSSTLLLADAAAAPPSTSSATTSSTVSSASSHDIVTLSACFQFLSPNELIQAHSTCRQWHLAAANPLTFRAQIRVLHRDHVGIVTTGPKVSFSRPNRMKLAFESSLFQNFRILHLIGARFEGRSAQHFIEEWKTMIQSTMQFKSFHTLRLSVSNLSLRELILNGSASKSDPANQIPPSEFTLNSSQYLLNQLFESATCKYLQVLTLDITSSQLFFAAREFFPYFPRTLRHLQLNLMMADTSQSIIPANFVEQVAKLTELRSLVIADDELRLLVHSRMNGVIKQNDSQKSLLTLRDSDIVNLSSLSTRMPALDIRCIICIDIEQLVNDDSPLIRQSVANVAASSSASSPSVFPIRTLQLEEIYIKDVNLSQPSYGYLFHLLSHVAPRARCLTLINVSADHAPKDLHPFVSWPATIVESLTSMLVIYGNMRAKKSNHRVQHDLLLGSAVLVESNLLFAPARFTNLTSLSLGMLNGHKNRLNDHLADFFATLPSLTHLSLSSFEVPSFSSLIPLRKMRVLNGLQLSVEELARQGKGKLPSNGFQIEENSKDKKFMGKGTDIASESSRVADDAGTPNDFQRALERVTEIGLDLPQGRLTAPLLTSLLSLPAIEKVRVNGGAPLSRKMLRIHMDKIEKIREGFKTASAAHERLEEEVKVKKESLGYKCDGADEQEEDIEVDEEERRSLRSSLVSTLQQAREQEKSAREQLSRTEYEARVGGETDLTLSAAAKFRANRSKKGPCVFDGSATPETLPASSEPSKSKSKPASSSSVRHPAQRRKTEDTEEEQRRKTEDTEEDLPRNSFNEVLKELAKLDGTLRETPNRRLDASVQRAISNNEESVEEDELAAILYAFAKSDGEAGK